jgi:predicted esterase
MATTVMSTIMALFLTTLAGQAREVGSFVSGLSPSNRASASRGSGLRGGAQAETPEALRQEFRAAVGARDWPRVISSGEKLYTVVPDSGAAYNLACAYAQTGSLEKAVSWLTRAAEDGFQGLSLLQTDRDLDPIRSLSGYVAAEKVIRASREKGFEEFRRLAEAAEPHIILSQPLEQGRPPVVIIALHGYGGTGEGIGRVWREPSEKAGAILAAPDALRPAGGRGYAWVFRDESEWWVLETIRRIRAQLGVDSPRVVLAGFSQGANVALRVGLKYPSMIEGVIAISGEYDRDVMHLSRTADHKPRVYLLIGDRDPGVSTFRAALDDFKAEGLDVRLRIFSGGHQLPQSSAKEFERALKFVLSN